MTRIPIRNKRGASNSPVDETETLEREKECQKVTPEDTVEVNQK